MCDQITRFKGFNDLKTVQIPYVPGGYRYRVSENEAYCILDGYLGYDGVYKEGCHVIDTVPIMYSRGGTLYTAPHIVSLVRDEIMHCAAHVALQSTDCMKAFVDYVWYTVGSPPAGWGYYALYEQCIQKMHVDRVTKQ